MATLPLVIGKMLQSFAGVIIVITFTYHHHHHHNREDAFLASPSPYKYTTKKSVLCRFVKDPVLWACLAGLAVHSKHLDTAEVAYAAIQEADKVVF